MLEEMGGRRVAVGMVSGCHAACVQGQASQLAADPCSGQRLQARAGPAVCARWKRCTKQVGLRTALNMLAGSLSSMRPPLCCIWEPPLRSSCYACMFSSLLLAEGVLGTVYLDLVRRPHKFPSAAHFTLRCSRRLADGSYQVGRVGLGCRGAWEAQPGDGQSGLMLGFAWLLAWPFCISRCISLSAPCRCLPRRRRWWRWWPTGASTASWVSARWGGE